MTDKIVSLRGGTVLGGEPSDALVEYLEDLLEQARSGHVVGIAAATVESSGVASYAVVGRVGGFGLSGALACAQHLLCETNIGRD